MAVEMNGGTNLDVSSRRNVLTRGVPVSVMTSGRGFDKENPFWSRRSRCRHVNRGRVTICLRLRVAVSRCHRKTKESEHSSKRN